MKINVGIYGSISFGTDTSQMSDFLHSTGGIIVDSYYTDGVNHTVKGFHISQHADVMFTLSSNMQYIDIEIVKGATRRVYIAQSSGYSIEGLTWNSNNIYYIAENRVNQNRVYSNDNYNILNLDCSVSPIKKTLYSYADNSRMSVIYNRLVPSSGFDYVRDVKDYGRISSIYASTALLYASNSVTFKDNSMESLVVPEMYTIGYVPDVVDIVNYTLKEHGIVNAVVGGYAARLKKTVFNHYISI